MRKLIKVPIGVIFIVLGFIVVGTGLYGLIDSFDSKISGDVASIGYVEVVVDFLISIFGIGVLVQAGSILYSVYKKS